MTPAFPLPSLHPLEAISEFAELHFTPDDVAIITGVDVEDLKGQIRLKDGPLYHAYMTGYLRGQARIRTGVLEMAERGSAPAQKLMGDWDLQVKTSLTD